MSDDTKAKPFATASSGKSPEEIAFELVNKLKGQGVWGERNISAILDMYAECLDATKGLRIYDGQSRIEAPIKKAAGLQTPAEPIAQAAPQMVQPTAPQNVQAQIAQAQAQQAAQAQIQAQAQAAHQQQQAHIPQQTTQPAAQPVHAQQAHLQQAFKQG